MTDKDKDAIDDTEFSGRSEGGDSAGGAYQRPKSDSEGKEGGFMGHGGQSEMPYHGHGQLGDEKVGSNPNSPAEKGK